MIETSKKDYVSLEQVLYTHYLLYFQKDIIGIRALINSSNKVNVMILAYATKLSLKGRYTNIES